MPGAIPPLHGIITSFGEIFYGAISIIDYIPIVSNGRMTDE
jgi:hypothetical protein